MNKIDHDAKTVEINSDGMVRVDGIPVCKRIIHGDGVYIQFKCRSRRLSQVRGTELIEVSLDAFKEKLEEPRKLE